MIWARPDFGAMAKGLIPRISGESLYVAIGILGATVMPHNLYLHGALVQTRRIGKSSDEKRVACRFNLYDSVIALNGALLVNAAILVLSASTFYSRGIVVNEIQKAHELLSPLLGTAGASVLFAVALLASGQSSTLTGTMAGQIVMEGFLNFRMRPWLRRLVTRMVAIVPAALTVWFSGEQGTYKLLILSQVMLSMQLPFAVIPLIQFTSNRDKMGEFVNAVWVRVLAWTAAAIIVSLNVWLVIRIFGEWLDAAGPWLWLLLGPLGLGVAGLLVYVTLQPWVPAWKRATGAPAVAIEAFEVAEPTAGPSYQRILVTLDHSDRDKQAVSHSASLAKAHGAKLFLVHVEEGVTSVVFGAEASTAEVQTGERYFEDIAAGLRAKGFEVELIVRHSPNPSEAIIQVAKAIQPDLVVMAAHGHKWYKDLIFGATINAVRHDVAAPVLIVR